MKRITLTLCCLLGLLYFAQAQDKMQAGKQEPRYQPKPYVPESPELYRTIVALDSTYFDTYNTCNLEKMGSMMNEDFEFYHDRGGLSKSKADNLASIKNNICGKVTRVLTKGSIEVYPIKGYGAVEIGYHSFKNLVEKSQSEPSKFIIIWQHTEGTWRISRVISLH